MKLFRVLVKSSLSPPKEHVALEMFLGQLEKELFSFLPGNPHKFNLTREKWKPLRGLADGRSIIIKPANKRSCVVVWDREDYLTEDYKQLQDSNVYQTRPNFGEKELTDLVDRSSNLFKELFGLRSITEKEMKYFPYNFKKTARLGNMYLLPKIQK